MKSPQFSRRTAWDTAETIWARLMRERRAAALPILDLTASNPTACGFDYDEDAILAALRHPAALQYDPDPKGLAVAREAVAGYYADHGASVSPEQILLTTSTSEAYSFVFRLLCDPGDEILVAKPSYPLFDYLAELDDVQLVSYPLFYDSGWHLDPHALRERITARTRAIVLVHPNNPTGNFTKPGERAALEDICVEHGLALIVDEVFLDYPLEPTGGECSFTTGNHPVLTLVLSGISKIAGLPQMKAAWLACLGPEPERTLALDRLEIVADTFLSMNAPTQLALPSWLGGRRGIQDQINGRIRSNLKVLDEVLVGQELVKRLSLEAGWSTILRIPAIGDGETAAEDLLNRGGIAVHSGDSFGLGLAGWLVVSILTRSAQFLEGITLITNLIRDKNKF